MPALTMRCLLLLLLVENRTLGSNPAEVKSSLTSSYMVELWEIKINGSWEKDSREISGALAVSLLPFPARLWVAGTARKISS